MTDDFLPRGDQEVCLRLRDFRKRTARGGRMAHLKLSRDDWERLREKSAALEEAGWQRQFLRQAAGAVTCSW